MSVQGDDSLSTPMAPGSHAIPIPPPNHTGNRLPGAAGESTPGFTLRRINDQAAASSGGRGRGSATSRDFWTVARTLSCRKAQGLRPLAPRASTIDKASDRRQAFRVAVRPCSSSDGRVLSFFSIRPQGHRTGLQSRSIRRWRMPDRDFYSTNEERMVRIRTAYVHISAAKPAFAWAL